ncbi:hypothetical protein JCM8547_006541 [Rhodosporidiobolus lusitaniae]
MTLGNTSLNYTAPPEDIPVPGKHLKRVTQDNFDPGAVQLDGGILVRVKAASLDPYMRGRMRDPSVKSYNTPFTLDAPLQTYAVGIVSRSEHPDVKEGDIYRGRIQFAEWAVVRQDEVLAGDARVLKNEEGLAFTTLVGAAGMPGATAWIGLYNIGKPKSGETIFVSAASGAVGQIVCQLAKREGLKVIGSAGSDEKVEFLKAIGVDVAFNYKTQSTFDILSQHPFDLYFENVGGITLDAVLATISNKGRIIACGSVSGYNVPKEKQYRLQNYGNVVTKTLRWEGFIVSQNDTSTFEREFPKLIKSGEVKVKEHITQGIDNGEAFVDMLEGKNFGKAVVSLE